MAILNQVTEDVESATILTNMSVGIIVHHSTWMKLFLEPSKSDEKKAIVFSKHEIQICFPLAYKCKPV